MEAVKEKEVTKSYYDAHDVSIMLGIGLASVSISLLKDKQVEK